MQLSPHETERLLIRVAVDVAERRRARGLRLNHPEAVAIITAFLLAGARCRPVVVVGGLGQLKGTVPAAMGLGPWCRSEVASVQGDEAVVVRAVPGNDRR
jgi:hypothetical protein